MLLVNLPPSSSFSPRPGCILEVLNDPMFEYSQPSWVRRSLQSSKVKSAATPTKSDGARVVTDGGEVETDGGEVEEEEVVNWSEIETEFVSQKEKEPARVRTSP